MIHGILRNNSKGKNIYIRQPIVTTTGFQYVPYQINTEKNLLRVTNNFGGRLNLTSGSEYQFTGCFHYLFRVWC